MKHLILISLLIFSTQYCKKKPKNTLQAGIVTFASGEAKLLSSGNLEKPISKNSLILIADTVITGKDSLVDIQLMNGTQIRVKQNSRLRLETLFIEEKTNSIRAKFKLISGKVFVKTNAKLNALSSFEVSTTEYLAGVRGTEFLVDEKQTLVSDGSVEMKLLDEKGNPTEKQTVIEKGNKGDLSKGSIITKTLSKDELKELVLDSKEINIINDTAKKQIEEILETLDEQKQINSDFLKDQLNKNETEKDNLKKINSENLNQIKETGKEAREEIKSSTKMDEIKENSTAKDDLKEKANKQGLKDQSKSDLDEIKAKASKDQVAPK